MWPARRPALRTRRLFAALLLQFLICFPSCTTSEWNSSGPPRAPLTAADLDEELVRDAPLYPPLRHPLDDPQHYDDRLEANEIVYNEPETGAGLARSTTGLDARDHETEAKTMVQSGGEEDVAEGDVTSQHIDDRKKRSSGSSWHNTSKAGGGGGAAGAAGAARRVQTGDTILNIRGALRDSIGDAGAAPPPAAPAAPPRTSRVDTFVIRPAHAARRAPPAPATAPPRALPHQQAPRYERELLVEAHSRAHIECDLRDVTDIKWYKDNELFPLDAEDISAGLSAGVSAWRGGAALELARASRGDAGAWRCAGRGRGGEVLSGRPTQLLIYEAVRAVYLAVDGRRLDAGNTWVPVRDKTVLEVRCVAEGGVPAPELSWRLLAQEPGLEHRPYLRIHPTNYSIDGVWWSRAVVTAARELHNATLRCEARQRGPTAPPPALHPAPPSPPGTPAPPPHHTLAAKLEIHVTYPPSFVISRWPGFGVSLVAGGAAALRCDVDANPPARAWWLRDDAPDTSSPPPATDEGEGGGGSGSRGAATLRWAALAGAHAGWYRCRASWLDAEYSSIGYYLNVISPEETDSQAAEEATVEEPVHQKVEVPLGGSVQLHCPKGSVGCWSRRVVGNATESWAPAGSQHAHGVLGIKDALYQEGGEYRCVGAQAPDMARLRELKRVTLRVTGGAATTATALSAEPAAGGGWRLACGACGRGAVRVLWVWGRAGRALPAQLQPDLAQHCWRAELLVQHPDEVWCVAVGVGGDAGVAGGAVAVFPPRATPRTPAPARHTVRALHDAAASAPGPAAVLLLAAALLLRVAK